MSSANFLQIIKFASKPARRLRKANKVGSRKSLTTLSATFIGLGGLVLALAAWQLVYNAHIWSEVFVPSPAQVASKFLETTGVHDGIVGYEGHTLWEHLGITLQRILLSAGIAILIGVPLGIILGLVPVLNAAVGPWITFLRQLPPLAYFSLLIIWFGIDEAPKLILLVVAAIPPIVVATVEGIRSVNKDYILAAKSLGAGWLHLVTTVYAPSALPEIFTGIRLGIGVAYTSVVAAETVNGLPGLGGMIRDAQRYNITSVVVLGIITLGLTGLLLETLLSRLQKQLTPWRSNG